MKLQLLLLLLLAAPFLARMVSHEAQPAATAPAAEAPRKSKPAPTSPPPPPASVQGQPAASAARPNEFPAAQP